MAFALITAVLAVGTSLLFMTGVRFPLSHGLIALALGAAVANGLFDFNTALVRARFHDGLYIKLIIVKNLLALLLTRRKRLVLRFGTHGADWGDHQPVGFVSLPREQLSVIPMRRSTLARFEVARSLLKYTLPIVAANLLYLCIPLANRSLIAVLYGFSETGQFSLAYDIGTKAVQAIGSTLDVLLFQIAVAAHDRLGEEQAKQRVGDNMAIVIAIILPACTGIWLVLPSIQALIVPAQYRGPFEQLLTLMMPGFFFFAMILYALNPIFQIRKRTAPLIIAAAVACISDPLLLLALPRAQDASSLATAQSGAFALAFFALYRPRLLVEAGVAKVP